MWNDSNYEIMNVLDNIENTCFPTECPVCKRRAGHIFFYRHREDYQRGGVWIWCSECHNSSHASCKIPKWWNNPDFIRLDRLTSLPDYLEENKICIDEWVNMLIIDITTD